MSFARLAEPAITRWRPRVAQGLVPDGDTHPVVLQIYGGGWRSGTRDSNAAFARALAGAGYVVFAID